MRAELWERKGMYKALGTLRAYVGQLNLIQRVIFVVNRNSLHGVQGGVCTINDLAEDGVLAV